MHRRALEGREKILGPDHPDTLTSVNNLAGVLQSQGKYDESEEMHRRALEGREKILGPDHPNTLSSVKNLATVVRLQAGPGDAGTIRRRPRQELPVNPDNMQPQSSGRAPRRSQRNTVLRHSRRIAARRQVGRPPK
ncbi:unnamed protein product [Tuber aestivum]|uniref:Kinesin light chain n=1 Tax=Tuber aestivum TaxID=59557 RepID=A0A292PIU7_9PEZI|nr:unnamed protein product [Tuber aestivum]